MRGFVYTFYQLFGQVAQTAKNVSMDCHHRIGHRKPFRPRSKTRIEIVESMDPQKLSEIIMSIDLIPRIFSSPSVVTILIFLVGLLIAIRWVNQLRNSPSL